MYNFKDLILNFLVAFVLVFIALYFIRNVENEIMLSILLSIIIIFALSYLIKNKEVTKFYQGKGMMRYTLLCRNCNWEWMSNVTEDKRYSKKCPNCGDNSKIEVIGVRKVSKLPKKTQKDLTSYFKR